MENIAKLLETWQRRYEELDALYEKEHDKRMRLEVRVSILEERVKRLEVEEHSRGISDLLMKA